MVRTVPATALWLALSGAALGANSTEWHSRSIYQVMVDRYARTDGSTTAECQAWEFCGGTWTGLLNKLDYIQGMGFTAIQISPIVRNIEENTAAGKAYHGYWTEDNYAINEHFGTEDDLKKLIAAAHDRDMFVMVDVVVNNMAQELTEVPPTVDFTKFNPFNDAKYFHPYCNVTNWGDPTNYQDCWLYPYGVALADLDTNSQTVVDMQGKWIKELVSNYSIDGLRIDAAKHVNDAFLPAFVNASGVFALGEVLNGNAGEMCRYQTAGLLPGMPNYVDYYPLQTIFNGGDMSDLADTKAALSESCGDIFALGSFVENHDLPRFAAANPDLALAKNAMAYILLNDGIPTVYQGQEQHFNGNSTPFNREPLWQSNYDTSSDLYKLTATLNKIRNKLIALDAAFPTTHTEQLRAEINHYCLRKGPTGSQVVFCITNKSSKGDSYQMSIGGFTAGDNVVEVLGCTTTTADVEGNVTMYMSKGEPKAYVVASVLEGTGLCNTTQDAADAAAADSGASGRAAGMAATAVFAAVVGWAVAVLA